MCSSPTAASQHAREPQLRRRRRRPADGHAALRLTIRNPKLLLRSGQYVRVSVDAPAQADAIVIPQRAVQELQDKRFVWTVDKDGNAAARDVTMGARIGPDWQVLKGLAAGDTVVVDGTQKLKQGVAVDTAPRPGAEPRSR